jgi:large subunit ribosomal protein L1
MGNVSKRRKANEELIDKTKIYTIEEAVELAKKTANTKFKGSLEVHVNLGIDAKKTDQAIRVSVSLPNGTGKTKKVAAFVSEGKEKEAKEAGAVLVGGEELIQKIKETEKTDFDIAVAEPAMMRLMAPIAKILGQRGLMPNPKSGTVTEDIAGVIKQIAGGKVDIKNDGYGILHQIIGKTEFDTEALVQNFKTMMEAINAAKPTTLKKPFITGIVLNATMGPGIKVKI